MAITPRTLARMKSASQQIRDIRKQADRALSRTSASIPGRPFGTMSEAEVVKMAKRYSIALDEYEQINMEIEAVAGKLLKRKSKLGKEIQDLKDTVKDTLEPGMKRVAEVRGGLLKWSIEQRGGTPGYKQILEEAEARMLDQLGEETGNLALQILRDAVEATKGVRLAFNNIQFVADMEEGANRTANRKEAGLLDRLYQAIKKLTPMIDRVKGVLGLARKRMIQDSDTLMGNLAAMRKILA
jgi:hypothetical protein